MTMIMFMLMVVFFCCCLIISLSGQGGLFLVVILDNVCISSCNSIVRAQWFPDTQEIPTSI